MTVLEDILAHKIEEVASRRVVRPLAEMEAALDAVSPCRGFASAIGRRIAAGGPAVIAEIKRASPSKGLIRSDFQPAIIARQYEDAGATCLSVLTDERYFQGHDEHLSSARAVANLPVLRKDFIVDPYQLVESRLIGADCVLLIVAALDPVALRNLHDHAITLGLDVLVEVHDRQELETALALGPKMVGINNRNLKTFETRLDTTSTLIPSVPAGLTVVTESGIRSNADVAAMRAHGVHAFLVGEAFMRATDPGKALTELFRC